MRAFLVAIGVLASGLLAGPSFAANQKDISDCDQSDRDDLRIAGCTRLINARDVSIRSIASAYNKRGIAWKNKREFDKAIADYGQAIKTDPKLSDPWHNRAQLFLSRKEYDKAIVDYIGAIKLDPGYAPSFRGRADCWDYKKQHDKAIADYNQAIRLDPSDPYGFSGRADAYASKKDHDRAIAD